MVRLERINKGYYRAQSINVTSLDRVIANRLDDNRNGEFADGGYLTRKMGQQKERLKVGQRSDAAKVPSRDSNHQE